MKTGKIFEQAKELLKDRTAISAMTIQRNFNVHFPDARRIIKRLQNAGLITEDWDASEGGYVVRLAHGRRYAYPLNRVDHHR